MIKVEVIEQFTLREFSKIKNLVRYNPNKKENGRLYVKDNFECDKKMADYLMGENSLNKRVVKVIEEIPDEKEKPTPKTATNKTAKKTSANK